MGNGGESGPTGWPPDHLSLTALLAGKPTNRTMRYGSKPSSVATLTMTSLRFTVDLTVPDNTDPTAVAELLLDLLCSLEVGWYESCDGTDVVGEL